MPYEWSSLRKSTLIREHDNLTKFEVSTHPLKLIKQSPSRNLIDTINKWSAAYEEIDPLLRYEKMNLDEEDILSESTVENKNYSKAWSSRRTQILSKYTTGEKLTIVSSFLPGGEKTLIKQVSNLNEKVKNRLEQLDDFEEGSVRKTMGLSQQEYVNKINVLNDEIKKAWGSEQRVKAFKIAIQCSKLLSDVSVMQFYPSKFILITDILDNFGNLVFQRLKEKSYGDKAKNVLEINPNMVPEAAKETCQNWIFKMASIRELLPRLYLEMTLLKCYMFIAKEEIEPTLSRLTVMIRGIGNPLVAIYLRVYLCRVASMLVETDCEKYFYENFREVLEDYQQIFDLSMQKKYESQLLTLDKYLSLYIPAVQDWLLFGALNSDKYRVTLLDECLEWCSQREDSELLLCCVVTAFDSANVAKKTTTILDIVQKNYDKMVMVPYLLTSLGEHLCTARGVSHVESEKLIQAWWKIASNIKSTPSFLKVLAPWLQYACTNLSAQYINVILRGTIRYMIRCGQPADEYSAPCQLVIKRILNSITDVEELFLMDAFMPLVELVQTSNARVMMAKTVLSLFFSRYTATVIDDHIIISSLMRLCRILHDSVKAVTLEDESKANAELINKFIQLVSYHDDLEQQLNFYVECRGAFLKLDAVMITLVHAVNSLAARAGAIGERSRWLLRACAAYCFVTVPSLRCNLTKSHLYLLSGQVALLNGCIGQAEANFKAFISLIPDIPEYIVEDGQKKPTNIRVGGLMSDFLSTLLILPDNVDSQCKAYILSGFIRTMEKVNWKKTDPLYYTTLLRTLDLLAEMTQENYAYCLETVTSNDKLYGNEEEFIHAIETYATNICQELLGILKALGDAKEKSKQYNLCMELLWRLIRRADLESASMMSLASNLWLLSQKIQETNNRIAKSFLLALESEDIPARKVLLQKIQEHGKL